MIDSHFFTSGASFLGMLALFVIMYKKFGVIAEKEIMNFTNGENGRILQLSVMTKKLENTKKELENLQESSKVEINYMKEKAEKMFLKQNQEMNEYFEKKKKEMEKLIINLKNQSMIDLQKDMISALIEDILENPNQKAEKLN